MQERPLIWSLFLGYLAMAAFLAWRGHRRTTDIKTFAIGTGKMNPLVVGITLSASLASTATFVINPGFVYVHGISALINLAGAVTLGAFTGLSVMSFGFRRLGARQGALTLPEWIGQRYGARGLSMFFAAANMLNLTFVVLILGGISIVMQQTLGLGNTESLLLMVAFVFGSVFVGGTYAHVYTNMLQGILMAVTAAALVGSGIHHFSNGLGPVLHRLADIDPHLATSLNSTSPLFASTFSVYVSGFIIGFALMCQPHVITKALYVDSDRSVRTYLLIAIGISVFYALINLVGIYAHMEGIPKEAFLDSATGAFRQDRVMSVYVTEVFSAPMIAITTVALIAAGMSTLDGVLVTLSSIAANDLYLRIAGPRRFAGRSESEIGRSAHRAGRVILLVIGVLAFLIALRPPKLLGIFGQIGVYGLTAASVVPILFGILFTRMGRNAALAAAATALAVHFGLYGLGQWANAQGVDLVAAARGLGFLQAVLDLRTAQLGFLNPGVTATYGILASALVASSLLLWARASRREPTPAHPPA